ncbi:hypothetical protein NHX12_004159 [Muraenolepis orangiensis]|uniref:Cadherin domain-containing protein n=1 Tax=Muraenolepis orangiensis TaxID=630683 RepID=A0A9Q0DUP7_9TELE|nr:hypothetical protein NHX12_004159 [Muraenolepis orangiensis]
MDRKDGLTKYVLRGEGAGSVFVIDEKTGNIHITKPLDREEKDEYRLIATATDRQTERALEPSSQFIIRVQDINDNPPVFAGGPYSATVPEMANIGTSIIQVTATDADDPTYGNSARLVYTLVQGQQYFSGPCVRRYPTWTVSPRTSSWWSCRPRTWGATWGVCPGPPPSRCG